MSAQQALFEPDICLLCDEGLQHCHGTAICHLDGGLECTEDLSCELPQEVHDFLIFCIEITCPCSSAEVT